MRARAITCALAAQAVALVLGASSSAAAPVAHHRAAGAAGTGTILDYWTSERLRSAEPRRLGSAPAGFGAPHRTATAAGGSPGSVTPAPPTVDPPAGGPSARPLPDDPGATAYVVPDSDLPPNTVHGKVFAKDRSGPFQCSATSVNSTSRSVVVTAGHCVRLKPFGWAKKFIFIPSYRDGAQPYGAWEWSSFHVAHRWARKQNSNYDFAAVAMSPRAGLAVQDAVGGAGFAWNQPRAQTYRSFGYPSNFFAGERMMGCLSTSRAGPDFGPGPQMQGMICDMGKGSSGGGWLTEGGLLNSVQSLGRRDFSAGPYFGKSARRALNRAQAQ
jgi:hypothetical protein